jgi:hypothetical protein
MKENTKLQHEKRDSITLKRNAKGEYAWDAKLYYDAENENIADIVEYLHQVDKRLKDAFERQPE